jgi:hypothetical protein
MIDRGAMNQDTAETNFYAPPQAQIAEPIETIAAPPFYVVSERKFLVLYFATIGMYAFYWFWRHWKLHKIDKKLEIWPVLRSIFQIFFAHSLNREIDYLLERRHQRYAWSPSALATVFVVFTIISNVADRLSWRGIGSPYSDLVSLVTLLPLGYCLFRSQRAANIACGDVEATANRHFTITNYVWITLGMLFWAMILLGMLLPEDPTSI